jgi:hypothetical protein
MECPMFVETLDGRSVRIDAVREVIPKGTKVVRLILSTGGESCANGDRWHEAVSRYTARIIPAQAGTYRLFYGRHENGEFWHGREPVIGWALDAWGFVDPIIATGRCAAATVLLPDGTVQDFCTAWDTIDGWLEDMKSERPPSKPDRPTLRLVE